MGFWDSVGDFAGEMMGRAVANHQDIMQYKEEYEYMTNQELKREYDNLKSKSDKECRLRLSAVRIILQERGCIKPQ